MKNVLIALSLVLSTSFVYADAAKKEDKPPVTAQKKPEVKKPCKEGQTAEKDKCHEVKKIEKKK
jgi:hypothetical protein